MSSQYLAYLHAAHTNDRSYLHSNKDSCNVDNCNQALALVCVEGKESSVHYLLQLGEKFKLDLNFSLVQTSGLGRLQIVKILIDHGANNYIDAYAEAIKYDQHPVAIYLCNLYKDALVKKLQSSIDFS